MACIRIVKLQIRNQKVIITFNIWIWIEHPGLKLRGWRWNLFKMHTISPCFHRSGLCALESMTRIAYLYFLIIQLILHSRSLSYHVGHVGLHVGHVRYMHIHLSSFADIGSPTRISHDTSRMACHSANCLPPRSRLISLSWWGCVGGVYGWHIFMQVAGIYFSIYKIVRS